MARFNQKRDTYCDLCSCIIEKIHTNNSWTIHQEITKICSLCNKLEIYRRVTNKGEVTKNMLELVHDKIWINSVLTKLEGLGLINNER